MEKNINWLNCAGGGGLTGSFLEQNVVPLIWPGTSCRKCSNCQQLSDLILVVHEVMAPAPHAVLHDQVAARPRRKDPENRFCLSKNKRLYDPLLHKLLSARAQTHQAIPPVPRLQSLCCSQEPDIRRQKSLPKQIAEMKECSRATIRMGPPPARRGRACRAQSQALLSSLSSVLS